ncbi:hypothetical protein AAFF_G00021800 [Aldrovandia affinis]|uniref:Uncharacterized protein n=1 Tax=Aldrovandia affinis TaxID=143900 RepID=A0AAD7S522_9TELE|nr:hypothetical protein AAFF_G00021800 [Aldrovandia affinis]
MYSVEDLLISHGYKLPKNAAHPPPHPPPPPPSCEAAHHGTDSRRETVAGDRSGHGTANGSEAGVAVVGAYAVRGIGLPPPAKGCPGEWERSQGRAGAGGGNQGDTQKPSPGDFLSVDSG